MGKFQIINYRLVSHPLVIGLLLGVLTVLIAPPIVQKYKVKTSLGVSGNNHLRYYMNPHVNAIEKVPVDLWLDSYSNVCALENDLDSDDHEIYSRRLIGMMLQYPAPHCADLDRDGNNEFMYLSTYNDTLCFYIHDVETKKLKRKVPVIPDFGNEQMNKSQIFYFGVHQDISKEHPVFCFAVGKSTNRLFCYDYLSNTLSKHLPFGKDEVIHNGGQLLSQEGKVFYAIRTVRKTKILDQFHLFDQDMHLLFSSNIQEYRQMYICDDQQNLVLYHTKSLKYFDLEASLAARQLMCKELPLPEEVRQLRVSADYNKHVFTTLKDGEKGKIMAVSVPELKSSFISIPGYSRLGSVLYAGDVDENGVGDVIVCNLNPGEEALIITEAHTGRHAVSIPLSREQLLAFNVVKQEKGKLLLQMYGTQLVIQYGENADYVYRWLWYLLIVVVYILISMLIQFVTKKRHEELYYYKDKMAELHMRNMRDRIDPHFVFNAINSSSSFLLCGERMEAYNYLSKLSGLLRYSLKHADQVMSPLKDELRNCQHFLDIQQMRFNNQFDYTIHMDEAVPEDVLVPPALLVNLTENCIKHGFNGVESGGEIKVVIRKTAKGLLILLEDNGIGRQAAAQRTNGRTSTGTGESVIRQYVLLLNRKNNNQVSFSVIDLKDDQGAALGTRSEFFIPDGMKF